MPFLLNIPVNVRFSNCAYIQLRKDRTDKSLHLRNVEILSDETITQ